MEYLKPTIIPAYKHIERRLEVPIMTLQSNAQELFVMDGKISPASQLPSHDNNAISVMPHHHEGPVFSFTPLEVSEDPIEVEIVVDELPGAPAGTRDPELLVSEDPIHVDDKDDNDAKKDKPNKNDKWDWSKHGPHGFVAWVKTRLDGVPKHSGYDSAGLERAMAYMEKLDNEISKAMRMDLDSELDANQVEKIRAQLDDGLSRLQGRLDKVKESKKSKKRKKTAQDLQSEIDIVLQRYEDEDIQAFANDTGVPGEEWNIHKAIIQLANNGQEPGFEDDGLVKQAQKIMGVTGLVITVPILISMIARACVNGTVSAGHDIEDMYTRQVTKWKLDDREQAEVRQLLFDMGYPLRVDRGFKPDEDLEVWDSDNFDWAANYRG